MTGWEQLVAAVGADATALRLHPPASEAAIAGLETLMECRLPADYRALLAIADGQDDDGFAIFDPDCTLLPIARVIEQWLFHGKFSVAEWDQLPVEATLAVRPIVWHRTRIPIAADYLGHGPFLDLWPGPAGTVGQVIQLVSECDFEVLAPSLDDYFTRRAASVAASHRSASRTT